MFECNPTAFSIFLHLKSAFLIFMQNLGRPFLFGLIRIEHETAKIICIWKGAMTLLATPNSGHPCSITFGRAFEKHKYMRAPIAGIPH